MTKPGIPKGTRDFSPAEMAKRNYIFGIIRSVFETYGYQQIETPSMENLSTLMGKYGEEGDKLLFKILNSGDWAQALKTATGELCEPSSSSLSNLISEKGLRYDLTVPFARYVVQHRENITFPFKRYQIQPVWRADRPQKGRYREFFQCDADVVGSDSLIYEVEMLEMIDQAFRKFGFPVTIRVNNRKILSGIAEMLEAADKIVEITVAIDKLDKIGMEGVTKELEERGLTEEQIGKLKPVILLNGSNQEKIETLRKTLKGIEIAQKGLDEMEYVLNSVMKTDIENKVEIDLTLARGLNYYTGTILEVKVDNVPMGSISGGGRYDNLTGIFGLEGVSGVGFSFGADRIYDVLTMLNLFPEEAVKGTKLIFLAFDQNGIEYSLPLLRKARRAGIAAEIYPEPAKMKKQMTYANNNNIPYVAIVGDNEIAEGKVMLKNMTTGEQSLLTIDDIIEKIKD